MPRSELYPFEVSFIRTHRAGVLAGLPIPQRIGFPDREGADLWMADVKEHPEISEVRVSYRSPTVGAEC